MRYRQAQGKGYEVSSKGDSRFSALYATMEDGRTLECHYQCDIKGYDPLGQRWRLGKGKPPLDRTITPDSLYEAYVDLWRTWANHNPELIEELKEAADHHGGFLSDMFGHGPVNQARALAQILNEKYGDDPT